MNPNFKFLDGSGEVFSSATFLGRVKEKKRAG
jgi:hypothetical protein